MPLAATSQILMDGPRNVMLKCTGPDTILPSYFSSIHPSWQGPDFTGFSIRKVTGNIADATSVLIAWDATTDTECLTVTGSDTFDFQETGLLNNNSGAGRTGGIQLTKTGTGSMMVILWLVKRSTNPL